jgi:hypothetical protein
MLTLRASSRGKACVISPRITARRRGASRPNKPVSRSAAQRFVGINRPGGFALHARNRILRSINTPTPPVPGAIASPSADRKVARCFFARHHDGPLTRATRPLPFTCPEF